MKAHSSAFRPWGILLATLFLGQTGLGSQGNAKESIPGELRPGVVVERVEANSEAAKAGIREGDVLLRWYRGSSQGAIESVFDLSLLEIAQSLQGSLRLEGLRNNQKQVWTMGPDRWGLTGRPNLVGILLADYREGLLVSGTDSAKAAKSWQQMAAQSSSGALSAWFRFHAAGVLAEARHWSDADNVYREAAAEAQKTSRLAAAVVLRAWAESYRARNDWVNAENRWQQVIELADAAGEEPLKALGLYSLGLLVKAHGDLVAAEKYLRQSLEIREKIGPESLDLAASINWLGNVWFSRGDLARAEEYHRRALAIRQKLVPESLVVAASFHNLGNIALTQDDLAKADGYYRQSLAIQEKLAPGSLDLAGDYTAQGVLANKRGDLSKAEAYYLQALEIEERLAPGSLLMAQTLITLSDVAYGRSDLEQAEQYAKRALAIGEKLAPGGIEEQAAHVGLGRVSVRRGELAEADEHYRKVLIILQKLSPGSLDVATVLQNRGNVALERGDLERAEQYYRQALTIRIRRAPGSLQVAQSLQNLGVLASVRNDLSNAEQDYQQALTLNLKRAPGSLDVALNLDGLSRVAFDRGKMLVAEEFALQALAIQEKLAPAGWDVARSLNNLGNQARQRQDFVQAEAYYRRALAIQEKLIPDSIDHAETLANLARVVRWKQPTMAGNLYQQALNALENQTARLGGTEDVRSSFRAQKESYYKEYIDLLLQLRQPEMAFRVLESWHARTLLETLTAARVDLRNGIDPVLMQQERSLRHSIAAQWDHRLHLLNDEHSETQIAAIDERVKNLLEQMHDVQAQIRVANPSYVALTQPQPLTATEVRQQLLDKNTVLLEYSLGEERSYVLALTPDFMVSRRLPGRARIEFLARRVYEALTARNKRDKGETANQRQARWSADVQYRRLAAQLSRMILGPVAAEIAQGRLLIVADGVLQYIPFAALPSPAGSSSNPVPLMVTHEVVELPSASVLAALRQEKRQRKLAPRAVAVLADPVFDTQDRRLQTVGSELETVAGATNDFQESTDAVSQEDLTRSLVDIGGSDEPIGYLPRLQLTRQEANNILAVTPPGEGLELLDFAASRANAIAASMSQYRILHFATHGLLNSKHPELSGLVLSLVTEQGRPQNGFLALQDIYNLHLPAELVVLSACETALGREIHGEGLIGLTRGFMYAGATSVIASLWKIDDSATAELMGRFYQAMEQRGMRPSAALREAQIQMWKDQRWNPPYYWAAFQLQGEWK